MPRGNRAQDFFDRSRNDDPGRPMAVRGLRLPYKWVWLLVMAALVLTVITEFFILGLARKTFMFYDIDSGLITTEDRKLISSSRELDITRYVQEALLGPASQNSLPLFPRGTRLRSLLYRDGIVYIDLTEEAALPPAEGGETLNNFQTFYSGLKRNFPYIRELRFFIDGRAAWTG